jgi:hypothetical protein
MPPIGVHKARRLRRDLDHGPVGIDEANGACSSDADSTNLSGSKKRWREEAREIYPRKRRLADARLVT